MQKTDMLKNILEGLYRKYNHREFIPPDPLQFVYRYSRKPDMEIAGFLAASFAYGAVEQIEKFLTILLSKMGKKPAEFIKSFSKRDETLFKSLKYRFNKDKDIINLLKILKSALNKYGSLEDLFLQCYKEDDENIVPAATKFIENLNKLQPQNPTPNIHQPLNLPDPADGSACKRLFLFLRWMVRKDRVDAGLWQKIDRSKLIMPVDVHIGRLSKILGLHNRKTINLKTAIEITKAFAAIEPKDPLKYDFALSRIGILKNCTGRKNCYCPQCELKKVCQRK